NMAWERGYYYRVHKVNGRVVREYIGKGCVAELAAQLDTLERQQRETDQATFRAAKAELDALDAPLIEFNDLADLLARVALVAAGFHEHKRQWRKRRVRREENNEAR